MRLLPLVSMIALLSLGSTFSLAPSARADEKYKSRPNVQPPADRHEGGGTYKRPPENRPPAERPPDREHPIKQPPPPRERPDPPTPHDPPTPPGGWGSDTGCPPPLYCPRVEPIDGDNWVDLPPIDEPVLQPIPMDLNSVLSRHMHAMQIEGFTGQVAVGYDGQIQFERSYGANGYFDIASVAKSFTAWAVYELIHSGKLSSSTTLAELFPNVPNDKRAITIEQLLAETSGLGNTYLGDGEGDRDLAVAALLTQRLAHAPGTMYTFSDDGYVILAAAIEVASHTDYESFLVDSGILSPDMTSTVFPGERGRDIREMDWRLLGAGDIFSTARDLFTWTSHFMRAPVMDDVVRPRGRIDGGMEVGYGWYWTDSENGPPLLRTSGMSGFGDNVMVVVYPNDTILVVASDHSYGSIPWSERVANSLEPVLRGPQLSEGPHVVPLVYSAEVPKTGHVKPQ